VFPSFDWTIGQVLSGTGSLLFVKYDRFFSSLTKDEHYQ